MAVIETMRFRLRSGVDRSAFLAADRRLQTEFAYRQAGLVRRTTAAGPDGEWLVLDVWSEDAAADACAARWEADPVAAAFMALVDEPTVEVRRYSTLD